MRLIGCEEKSTRLLKRDAPLTVLLFADADGKMLCSDSPRAK
jgi:hypothetical protein